MESKFSVVRLNRVEICWTVDGTLFEVRRNQQAIMKVVDDLKGRVYVLLSSLLQEVG